MKNAVGYIRVSTEQQGNEDKYGIQAQKHEISEYAKNNGYEIKQWFVDKISGVEEERPEWNKIIMADDIMNPPFEAVIVFKSDRVARDIKLYFYYLFLLEKKGIKLISVEEQFDGELANVYRALILFCAEQERKNIALRTSHGRKIKASAGGYAGGKAPYGYYVKDGRLLVDEYERPVVKYIFELLFETDKNGNRKHTYNEICVLLKQKGYHQRNGKDFTSAVVFQIGKNIKFYQGFYKYGKDSTWVKGIHERII